MAGKAFTPEEIRILSENPNTFEVSTYRLAFTREAKERILELSAAGKSARGIVIELGYDPEMLGDSRVKNIAYYVRLEAESGRGLHQGYAKRSMKRITSTQIAGLEENAESYARLKNEVIYLREEVEFLKKISQQVISGKRGK